MTSDTDRAATIAALNDACPKSRGSIGRHFTTDGVAANGPAFIAKAVAAVAAFDAFNVDNDPYGEHDFGKVFVDGQTLFWKIDLYEKAAVKHYSITKPLFLSSLPDARRRCRVVRSWTCASAHRLVSGEAQAPSSHNRYSRVPKAQKRWWRT